MDVRRHKDTSFSPYHDDGGWIDFLEDDAQRFTTNAALVFFVHVGLALALSANFIVPDLKPPPDPEPITVQIVSFDPVEPEPEPEPDPIVIEPVLTPPPPAPKPKPRPAPQPVPERQPPQPEPEPEPEPEIEPEVVITPPPPEILTQPEPEPEALEPVRPEPVRPEPELIEPEPLPEPEIVEPIDPEPIVEIFEPLPEPIEDPIREPELETEVAPLEPDFDIEIFDPVPDPDPEIIEEPLPLIEGVPPTPGVIEAEPLPEIIDPEPLPPEIIIEPEPEITPEPVEPTPAEPEVIEPDIIPTAPTVLASPDAPETREQERRAVPQEQSDPFLDLLERDRESQKPEITPPNLGGPATGGGNEGPVGGISAPPGGGTQRTNPNPGAGGWTLAPQGPGTSKAYEGLNLDMRCREEGRTHADCPEYVRKNRGRAADGSESFNGFAGTGTDRGDRIEDSRFIPSRGSLGLPIGDNSVNSGGPSTSSLDFQDTNFDREFLGKELYQLEPERGLLDDIFAPLDPVNNSTDPVLNPVPEDGTNEDEKTDWLLKTLPE